MEITEYFSSPKKSVYLDKIAKCEWNAAKFLESLLKENRFHEVLGGWGKLYLLVNGDELISFVTLSAEDCISAPKLTPWLGFFHTSPEYRGNRYGKILIDHVCKTAKYMGYKEIYLATDHTGLYEKYGFHYLENRIDKFGEDSRIYKKEL